MENPLKKQFCDEFKTDVEEWLANPKKFAEDCREVLKTTSKYGPSDEDDGENNKTLPNDGDSGPFSEQTQEVGNHHQE